MKLEDLKDGLELRLSLNHTLTVPKELLDDFIEWVKDNEESLTDDPQDAFDEYWMKQAPKGFTIVSAEIYDFSIVYELGIVPFGGGYPHSWTMTVPGYEITCFGWIDSGEIKHPDINMLAKKVEENERAHERNEKT